MITNLPRVLSAASLTLGAVLFPQLNTYANDDLKPVGLEEVIVTANKKEQNLQDVSGVVQSFDRDQLRADGISELRQIQMAVPGLSIANQEGNVEIYIRGVGSANNTELGDPATAPHINGVYIPRPRGLGAMFYDVERVEVNKGPQGTLYGRNALAGTLNIITAKPKAEEFSGYSQMEFTNRSGRGAEAAFNIPLGDNTAVRFAGYQAKRDYGFKNTGDQTKDPAGLQEDAAGRISFLTEPNDRLSVFLMADYGQERGTGYPGANIHSAIVATGQESEDLDLRNAVYRGPQGELENDNWGLQAKISYDFGPVIAEYTTSYRELDFYQRNAASDGIDYEGRDPSSTDLDVFSTQFWQQKSESSIHELRLISPSDQAVEWSLGAFLMDEEQESAFFSMADKGYCCYSGTEFTMPEVSGEAAAIYADATFNLSDSFRVFGGVRYTEEEKSRYGIGGNWALTLGGEDFACCVGTRLGTEGFVPSLLDRPNFDLAEIDTPQEQAQFLIEGITHAGARDTLIQQIGAIADGSNPNGNCFVRPDIDNGFVTCPDGSNPDTAYANGGFTYANIGIPSQQRGEASFNFVDGRIGFEMDLGDSHMVYGKVSTAHKSGGFNDNIAGQAIPEAFEPEALTVWEVGSRSQMELAGIPTTLNASAFYYDYKDQVFQDLTCINKDENTGDCNGFSLVNRNIAESTIYGFEFDSKFNFAYGFNLDLVASYLQSEITGGTLADARAQDFGAGGEAPTADVTGNRLPLQSDLSVSARLGQSLSLSSGTVDWQILTSYRSAYYLSVFNEDDVVDLNGNATSALEAGFPEEQDGFYTVNVGVGYSPDDTGMRIELFGNNITDEVASQKALVGSGLNIRFLNDARSYGVRFVANF